MNRNHDRAQLEDVERGLTRYRSIIEAIRDGVFVVDSDGRITYVNDSLCSLLGRDREELVGATFAEAATSLLVRPEEYDRFVSMIGEITEGSRSQKRLSFEISAEVPRVVEIQVSKHTPDEDTVDIVGVVRDVTERERRAQTAERKQEALAELYEVSGDQTLSFDEKAERILAIGCAYLDLPYGFLTRIEEGVQRMTHTVGDHTLLQPGESAPLERTYCRKTIRTEGLVGMEDARTELGADDPAYETFELGCYIGTKVMVGENLYGTFCFAGPKGQDQEFTAGEREVVKLLGQWSSYELERQRVEARLQGLHRVSQQLLVAETTEGVAETAVEAAAELFDLPITACWAYDSGADVLRPLAETDEAIGVVGETPTFERGNGLVWESFDSGEIRSFDDLADHPGTYNAQTELRAEVHVPLGTHGVMTTASTDPHSFDDIAIESIRLLGGLVSEAMTAVKREQRLIERGKTLQKQNNRLEEFAGIVSHDLRNPLAGAMGWFEMARETGDEAAFDRVDRALGRMDDLVSELLSLARMERDDIDSRATSLRSAVEEAWEYTDSPEATIVIDGPLGQVRADETRLLQVFGNLFRNSIQHGPDDVTVEVGLLADDEGFYVADDGPGMGEGSLAAVGSLGEGDSEGALGIGLTSVGRIVMEHGWELSAANTEEGLRFEIRTGEEA